MTVTGEERHLCTDFELCPACHLCENGCCTCMLLEKVRARGWTAYEGELPDGTPRTLIKKGDPALQKALIAQNIGRH